MDGTLGARDTRTRLDRVLGRWAEELTFVPISTREPQTPLEQVSSMIRGQREDSWVSHSVQVMVEWPDTPRAPWPRDSWLCVALGTAGGWGSSPGSVQLSLLGSGRYNNQWMIVDYKAFVPGGPSPGRRVLTVLEQIP